MYKIFYVTAVKKDIKALSNKVRLLIDDNLLVLAKNPFAGKFLHGEFKGYFSYSFSSQGTEYRIIYQVLKNELIVLIIMIGSRENLYRRLRGRV